MEIVRTLPRPCNDVGCIWALRPLCALCEMENNDVGCVALRPLRALCEIVNTR